MRHAAAWAVQRMGEDLITRMVPFIVRIAGSLHFSTSPSVITACHHLIMFLGAC